MDNHSPPVVCMVPVLPRCLVKLPVESCCVFLSHLRAKRCAHFALLSSLTPFFDFAPNMPSHVNVVVVVMPSNMHTARKYTTHGW
eukprot:15447283-Alexandrium_andersonii.AAC.1